jgi:hypothetical protein
MIEKLFEKIKDLDIRVYTLTSGRILIGELGDVYDEGVELHCPLEIKRLASKTGMYMEVIIPVVSGSDNEPFLVYDKSIETESFASIDIKRKYTEALIQQRVSQLLEESKSEETLQESKDSNNTFPELDKQNSSYSKDELLDIFLNRWKN